MLQPGCQRSNSSTSSSQTKGSAAPSAPTTTATGPSSTHASESESPLEQQLYGTWVAKDVDVKLGNVKIQLTFRKAGSVHLAAWSDIPFAGEVRNKSGPYSVNGDTLSSSALRGGTSVKFSFDDAGHLIIRYKEGKTVQFIRQ